MIAPNDQSLDMDFNDSKFKEKEEVMKDKDMKSKEVEAKTEANGWSAYYNILNKYLGSNDDLCPLLRVQGIFGITYCGNTPFGKSHSGLKKIGFVLYDSLFIILFLLVEYIVYSDDTFDRIFRQSSDKGIMNMVFKVSGLAIAVEYIAIKALLMVNGRDLYMSIHAIGSYDMNSMIHSL